MCEKHVSHAGGRTVAKPAVSLAVHGSFGCKYRRADRILPANRPRRKLASINAELPGAARIFKPRSASIDGRSSPRVQQLDAAVELKDVFSW